MRSVGAIEWLGGVKRRANRLGVLRQHQPKPLMLPVRYLRCSQLDDAPTLSIVTPTLNGTRWLADAMRSVVDQKYRPLEYVVQDGGSEDETREILKRWSARLTDWQSTPDAGQAQALNRGFARTNGELMAYLNADDLLLPGSISYVAEFMRRNPHVDVVYGHRVLIDEEGREIGRHVIPRHDGRVLSWADFIPQETLFWRRSTWDAVGGAFDESFSMALDWDLLVRLRDAGARMVRLPRFLGAFRVHGDQKTLTHGSTVGIAEMMRIRERIHGRPISQGEALRHVRPYLARHVALDQLYRRGILRY